MTSPTPPGRETLSGGGQLRNFTVNDLKSWKEAATSAPPAPKSKTKKTAALPLLPPPPPPESEGEAPDPIVADEG